MRPFSAFSRLFGRRSRVDSVAAQTRADAATARANRVLAETTRGLQSPTTAEPPGPTTAERRLDNVLAQDRARSGFADTEPNDQEPVSDLGPRPAGGPRWIPAASSFVDAFYWEPGPNAFESDAGTFGGDVGAKLWVRFTDGTEGYYENVSEAEYDDLFSAPSKGEWLHDHLIGPGARFHKTGTGPTSGTRLPWPRPGSRAVTGKTRNTPEKTRFTGGKFRPR